tara:strand:+ start:458 stop:1279 length:822 start_codon:yes stop_codon:yes gene_type:complete
MPCSIPPSNLALFIAKYLAKLEAYVISKIYEEVNKIIERLMGQVCPPVEEIKKILAVRDNLVNMINGLEKKIEPVKKFADIMDPPIQAAKATVLVLEMMPLPGTIGLPPGPQGGVIYSVSVGAQNRFAQLLNIACQIVDLLAKDQQAVKDLTDISFSGLDPIKQKLQSIDIQLFECVEKLPQDQKAEVLSLVENLPSNSGLSSMSNDGSGRYFYKNYTITIQEDKNSPDFAKKRFAQVENENGVVLMKGPSSFSSSTRILIDEIKFRINNQLP